MSVVTESPKTLLGGITRRPFGTVEEQDRAIRRRGRIKIVLGIAVPVVLLLFWEIAAQTRLIDPVLFPAPTTIVVAGAELLVDGRLLRETWGSLIVILPGFAIGTLIGLVLGILCGTIEMVRAALEPLLSALYVVPKLAVLPIFLLIFGFGNEPKVVLVAVTVFFYVWIEVMEASTSVPLGYVETARSLNLSPARMFTHLYFPAILPQLFIGMRIAMTVSVLVTIASEFVVGNTGLGYMIFHARSLLQVSTMYVGIVWVALLGVALTFLILAVGRLATPWAVRNSDRRSMT